VSFAIVTLGSAGEQPAVDQITVDRYLTEGQDRVVDEGHPDGRWLWATPGQLISRTDAERLGAIEPQAVADEPSTVPAPPVDDVAPPAPDTTALTADVEAEPTAPDVPASPVDDVAPPLPDTKVVPAAPDKARRTAAHKIDSGKES
jgi:hypothetical protein